MSKNSGKLPTLNAAITLSNKFDDRTKKRTYFVIENGEKKQMIEKDVKNLIPYKRGKMHRRNKSK